MDFGDFQADEGKNVSLTDNSLVVDISDALSEKDKVKFTVHTRTTMKNFQKPEFLVVRQHEEFIWLHDRYEEEPKYAGYIVSCLVLFRLEIRPSYCTALLKVFCVAYFHYNL